MRFIIEICDHCGQPSKGIPFVPYRIGEGPVRDICSACQLKPFKQPKRLADGHVISVAMNEILSKLKVA